MLSELATLKPIYFECLMVSYKRHGLRGSRNYETSSHAIPSPPRPQGTSGEKPKARDLIATMKRHEMYVYCGHGSGEQYVPLPMMRHLDGRCPAALLVGCSSGRLRRQRGSQYDPQGAVISYLMSGVWMCVCVYV